MYVLFLLNRLLRKKEWKRALKCEARTHFTVLRQLTAQRISAEHQNVIHIAQQIRMGAQAPQLLSQLQVCIDRLTPLLPFAGPHQRSKIEDAIRTADYAKKLLPEPKEDAPTRMTYYHVYIPTMGGAFYYLGAQPYAVGDVVSIPFGRENRMIFGVVQDIICDEYWKLPIPLWKMKYIEKKAPQAVADEYHHLCKNHNV